MNRHINSFRLAMAGIKYSLNTQSNFKIHAFCAVMVVLLGILLNISYVEWLLLIFTIILMITAEMVNTSIESMTNLITSEYHKSAKTAKDVSAGMVLISAIGSLIVGIVIFLPKILAVLY